LVDPDTQPQLDLTWKLSHLSIVENAKRIREEKEREDKFNETLGSCGSLSRYESKTFKNLLPQVSRVGCWFSTQVSEFQMLASSAAALFHVVVGISLAYSAILLPQLDSEDSDLKITKDQGAWIGE
jgi:facilitated trehalose transporter